MVFKKIPKETDQIIWQSDDDDTGKHHETSGEVGDATSGQKPRLDGHVVGPRARKVQDQAHPEDLNESERLLIVTYSF